MNALAGAFMNHPGSYSMGNVPTLMPPLDITREEIDAAPGILEVCCDAVQATAYNGVIRSDHETIGNLQ